MHVCRAEGGPRGALAVTSWERAGRPAGQKGNSGSHRKEGPGHRDQARTGLRNEKASARSPRASSQGPRRGPNGDLRTATSLPRLGRSPAQGGHCLPRSSSAPALRKVSPLKRRDRSCCPQSGHQQHFKTRGGHPEGDAEPASPPRPGARHGLFPAAFSSRPGAQATARAKPGNSRFLTTRPSCLQRCKTHVPHREADSMPSSPQPARSGRACPSPNAKEPWPRAQW